MIVGIGLLLFKNWNFLFGITDSKEMDTLEAVKKSTAEEQAKLNKRRQKFQAQDSVLIEPLGKSFNEE